MKDKFTIITEDYNTTTGKTIVAINTQYGVFYGETTPDEIDAKNPSIFQGNAIALYKALRKFAKHLLLITKEKRKVLKQVYAQISYNGDNLGSHECCVIRKTIDSLTKNIEYYNKTIEKLSNSIIERIKSRDKILKKYLDNNK